MRHGPLSAQKLGIELLEQADPLLGLARGIAQRVQYPSGRLQARQQRVADLVLDVHVHQPQRVIAIAPPAMIRATGKMPRHGLYRRSIRIDSPPATDPFIGSFAIAEKFDRLVFRMTFQGRKLLGSQAITLCRCGRSPGGLRPGCKRRRCRELMFGLPRRPD